MDYIVLGILQARSSWPRNWTRSPALQTDSLPAELSGHSLPKFSSVQSLSHIWHCETPWTAARQAFLSITNSQSLLKLMSIELVPKTGTGGKFLSNLNWMSSGIWDLFVAFLIVKVSAVTVDVLSNCLTSWRLSGTFCLPRPLQVIICLSGKAVFNNSWSEALLIYYFSLCGDLTWKGQQLITSSCSKSLSLTSFLCLCTHTWVWNSDTMPKHIWNLKLAFYMFKKWSKIHLKGHIFLKLEKIMTKFYLCEYSLS